MSKNKFQKLKLNLENERDSQKEQKQVTGDFSEYMQEESKNSFISHKSNEILKKVKEFNLKHRA